MSGNLLLALIVIVGGAVFFLLLRASPRLAFITWTLVLFFVPVWIGATAGFFWSAITLITLVALAAFWADIRFTIVDAVLVVFVIVVVSMFALKMTSLAATVIALLEWMLPYAWGRIVLAKVRRSFVTAVLAGAATMVAVLALVEFVTASNIFMSLPVMSASLFDEWGRLQIRAGMLRAEGAWGHSIALGAALAMSSTFVLTARWPLLVRLPSIAVIIAAAVVTFSRIGLLTLALTIVLTVVILPRISTALRWSVLAGSAVAAVTVIPFLGDVFFEAGDEAGGSADYRRGLFALVSQVRLFGDAGDWTGLTIGGDYLGAYARSIDNAFLVFALRFGWIPALLLLLSLALIAVTILRRTTASPPAIAVAAQLPALFAVALITQAGMYLWFLVGLAVAWRQLDAAALSAGTPERGQEIWSSRLSMSLMNENRVAASRR